MSFSIKILLVLLAYAYSGVLLGAESTGKPKQPSVYTPECIRLLVEVSLPPGLRFQAAIDPGFVRNGIAIFAEGMTSESTPLGAIFYTFTPATADKTASLNYNVWVHPEHRQQHLGSALVAELVRSAWLKSDDDLKINNSLEKLNLQYFIVYLLRCLELDNSDFLKGELPTDSSLYSSARTKIIEKGAAQGSGAPLLARIPWERIYAKTIDGKITASLGLHLARLKVDLTGKNQDLPVGVFYELQLHPPHESTAILIQLPEGKEISIRVNSLGETHARWE